MALYVTQTLLDLSNSQMYKVASQVVKLIKNLPANAGDEGDAGSVPMSGRFPGWGNGNPLPYSCLANCMDTGAWRAMVHGVTESWTQLSAWAYPHRMRLKPLTRWVRPIVTWILPPPHLPYCPLHLDIDILITSCLEILLIQHLAPPLGLRFLISWMPCHLQN